MAVSYLTNRKGGKAVTIRVSGTGNTTIQPTDLQSPDANNEMVTAFTVTKLLWSTTNNIVVSRGANTICVLSGTDHWALDQMNMTLNEFPTANLVVTINDANTTFLAELHKVFYVASDYYGA